MQGNVVDLCPVGALTSKPYAFAARPWELSKTQSVDVMDAVGSAIRVDTRGREVMRILPRINEAVNEEWISDKTRHVVDGLRTQRLDRPYIRENGKLRRVKLAGSFCGDDRRARSGRATSRADRRHRRRSCRGRGDVRVQGSAGATTASNNIDARAGRLDASDPQGWDARRCICSIRPLPGSSEADALLIIGANPRKEAAVLNARIRKRWRTGQFPVGLIGEQGRSHL